MTPQQAIGSVTHGLSSQRTSKHVRKKCNDSSVGECRLTHGLASFSSKRVYIKETPWILPLCSRQTDNHTRNNVGIVSKYIPTGSPSDVYDRFIVDVVFCTAADLSYTNTVCGSIHFEVSYSLTKYSCGLPAKYQTGRMW